MKVYGGTVALRGASLRGSSGRDSRARGRKRVGEVHHGPDHLGYRAARRRRGSVSSGRGGRVRRRLGRGRAGPLRRDPPNLALVENLSVAENIALAIGYGKRQRLIDWRKTRRSAVEALERLDHPFGLTSSCRELSVAQRAVVAIARAIAQDARLLILDEPTATLQADEARVLFRDIAPLRERGIACLLISHRIDEVLDTCDRVTVSAMEAPWGRGAPPTSTRGRLVELMVGKAERAFGRRDKPTGGRVLVHADRLTAAAWDRSPSTFEQARCWIHGARRRRASDPCRALFGIRRITGGALDSTDVHTGPPARAAIKSAVAYVPPDRPGRDGADLTARENLFMRPRDGR